MNRIVKRVLLIGAGLWILIIVAPMSFVSYGPTLKPMIKITRQEISEIAVALDKFRADCGSYPSAEQGLQALIVNRNNLQGWNGPYLKEIPVDPWGSPLRYILQEGGCEIRSAGPDCKFGTGNDMTNQKPDSQKRS